MDESEAVTKMLIDAGNADSAIDTILQRGPRLWLVRREGIEVELELDAEAIRLMLSVDLGAAAPARALGVYEAALGYGLLWQETGGVRIALAAPSGSLFMMVDLLLPELDPARLATALANLAQKAALWRRFVAGEFETIDEVGSDDVSLIRV